MVFYNQRLLGELKGTVDASDETFPSSHLRGTVRRNSEQARAGRTVWIVRNTTPVYKRTVITF
ncbi:MAG: hypothetical protein NVSMB9_20000 [Isosphaeraceae bacterium]